VLSCWVARWFYLARHMPEAVAAAAAFTAVAVACMAVAVACMAVVVACMAAVAACTAAVVAFKEVGSTTVFASAA
jgi:hypothetical protein